MAKLTAWLVTILGVWMLLGLLLPATVFAASSSTSMWATTIIVLVIGVSKLMRNYSARRK